jgi:hypothetical protein
MHKRYASAPIHPLSCLATHAAPRVCFLHSHCLVTFTSKQGATKALRMNGSKPLGRRLRVRPKLEPYSFSSMPLTLSLAEPPTFSFNFTFCVPRVPPLPANYPSMVCT